MVMVPCPASTCKILKMSQSGGEVITEGTWLVSFIGPDGASGSVLMLKQGMIQGETAAFRYSGTYHTLDGVFFADIAVQEKFLMATNFAGIKGNFEMKLVGSQESSIAGIEAVGVVTRDPRIQVRAVLVNIDSPELSSEEIHSLD